MDALPAVLPSFANWAGWSDNAAGIARGVEDEAT